MEGRKAEGGREANKECQMRASSSAAAARSCEEGRGESVHLHLPIEGGGGEGSDVGRRRRRRLKTAKFPSPVSALPNLCLASIPFIIKKTEGDGSGTKRSVGAVGREAPADTGKPSTHLPRDAKKGQNEIQGRTKPWVQFCVTQFCQVPQVR